MILPYTLMLTSAALLALAMAWSAWRQRAKPSARALMWLSLAVAEWTVTYALELAASDFASKLVWAKLEYIGIVGIPVAWLVLAVHVASELMPVSPLPDMQSTAAPFWKYSHVV